MPSFSSLARISIGGFIHRAASIGVRVKETISETAIAAADVSPKDDMKRPTIPVMNPTGMNTASSGKSRRKHREADLACSLDGRLKRVHALFFDESVDVLQHDDRVIDHDSDHKRQRQASSFG